LTVAQSDCQKAGYGDRPVALEREAAVGAPGLVPRLARFRSRVTRATSVLMRRASPHSHLAFQESLAQSGRANWQKANLGGGKIEFQRAPAITCARPNARSLCTVFPMNPDRSPGPARRQRRPGALLGPSELAGVGEHDDFLRLLHHQRLQNDLVEILRQAASAYQHVCVHDGAVAPQRVMGQRSRRACWRCATPRRTIT
jgi:hypothetical protein